MTDFLVDGIVDGDTFTVRGGWSWQGRSGGIIRPTGYDAPELHEASGQTAKIQLYNLIYGKIVRIGRAYTIDHGRLVCDVYFAGKSLADYFPTYRL